LAAQYHNSTDKPITELVYRYDKSQEDVKAIIENAAKSDFTDGSDEQKIGDFYGSYGFHR
jgi:putative endopeptidase